MSARGFLLLEAMLAAGVLAMGLCALLLLQLHSRQDADEAARRTRIVLFAASLAENWLAGRVRADALADAQRQLPAIAGRDAAADVRLCRVDVGGECRRDGGGPYAIVIDWQSRRQGKQRLQWVLAPP